MLTDIHEKNSPNFSLHNVEISCCRWGMWSWNYSAQPYGNVGLVNSDGPKVHCGNN